MRPARRPVTKGSRRPSSASPPSWSRCPTRPRCHLRRAGLHRLHGDLEACGRDLERAAERTPNLPGLSLGRSCHARAGGNTTEALQWVEHELAATPIEPDLCIEALELRAELLETADRPAEALTTWTVLIDAHPVPYPGWFLARAALQETPEAVAGLDAGLARIGDSVALLLRACDLEEEFGRIDAACARLLRPPP